MEGGRKGERTSRGEMEEGGWEKGKKKRGKKEGEDKRERR